MQRGIRDKQFKHVRMQAAKPGRAEQSGSSYISQLVALSKRLLGRCTAASDKMAVLLTWPKNVRGHMETPPGLEEMCHKMPCCPPSRS